MTFSTRSPAVIFVSAIVLAGCGGSSTPPSAIGPNGNVTNAATNQADTAAVEARLRGTWRIAEYRSEVPLEATLQGLLALQLQTMTVRFEGGRVLADSPTIHVNRAFKITDSAGPNFKFVATDESGSQATSACQFSDDNTTILFHSETEPWRGNGSLKRAQ
jgi:hypothetical protein